MRLRYRDGGGAGAAARASTPDRIIHTHPIKKASEIAEAIDAGVRTFVIDNEVELEKFAGAPADVRLLIRLAYRSPHAKSDLSTKFGVGPFEAAHLVERALERGIRIGGFSFHVGSQLDDPARFAAAITETLALMDHLESAHDVRFETLDIGGGFPVGYDSAVTAARRPRRGHPSPARAARRIASTIIAEPGRVLVAESMTLVTSVVGIAERGDGRWYYLDDGLYGSYSNVLTEDVHPLIFAEREIAGRDTDAATHRWATLAGPTCDSTDVIAREALLPDLAVGDLLVSPGDGRVHRGHGDPLQRAQRHADRRRRSGCADGRAARGRAAVRDGRAGLSAQTVP